MILVVGFPRSGNTFMTYIAGHLMGCHTVLRNDGAIMADGTVIVKKKHSIAQTEPAEALVFMLRNYRESLSRHIQHANFKDGIPYKELLAYSAKYLSLLRDYDQWNSSRKLLVYYEDLMENPNGTVGVVFSFLENLGASEDGKQHFVDNLPEHQKASFGIYGGSNSGSDVNYYSKILGVKTCRELDAHIKHSDEKLYVQFLKRYELPEGG